VTKQQAANWLSSTHSVHALPEVRRAPASGNRRGTEVGVGSQEAPPSWERTRRGRRHRCTGRRPSRLAALHADVDPDMLDIGWFASEEDQVARFEWVVRRELGGRVVLRLCSPGKVMPAAS